MDRIRVVFFGTPHFVIAPLTALIHDPRFQVVCVVTQQEKPVGRNQILQKSPVQVAAEKYGIDILTPTTLRENPEVEKRLESYASDLFVVDAYGKILPKKILDLPRLGCINLHPSLLPKYRGATPIPSALLSGDHETGMSIMKMDEQMDEGDILHVIPEPIVETDNSETLLTRTNSRTAEQLGDILQQYADGKITPMKQDSSKASYSTLLTKEMGKINWSEESALRIINKIRAFTPWPGVHTFLKGKMVKILSAELASGMEDLPFGTVVRPDLISTKSGFLKILQVIPEGKKEMAFADFVRGIQDKEIVLE